MEHLIDNEDILKEQLDYKQRNLTREMDNIKNGMFRVMKYAEQNKIKCLLQQRCSIKKSEINQQGYCPVHEIDLTLKKYYHINQI